ncbi:hypothetical protein PQX77_005879 [Marasmius sp. AFHP31]|nr:hypothetical protein PQX77_005879 [Marasmius sp. AFHP31]
MTLYDRAIWGFLSIISTTGQTFYKYPRLTSPMRPFSQNPIKDLPLPPAFLISSYTRTTTISRSKHHSQSTSALSTNHSIDTMSLYKLSPATSSTSSFASTSSTPESILAMYAHSQFDFTSPPSGAVLPLPGARRVRAGSFSEQRGYVYTIQVDAAKPIGEVKVAKGELEPRVGALPRRTRRKAQPQSQVPAPIEIEETKEFEFAG